MKITKVDNGKFKATFKQDINNSSIENQTDKYLFDRNKTIGFRKDKKLHKFVGLRDGYSKQLELTLKTVTIDGVEKIASNRVNFSELSLSGETVVHNINGLDFFNTINSSNYKNLVKIEEEFTELDIVYEVHLKGVKIYEKGYQSGGKTHYRQNHLGQFLIVDNGNKNILFSIETPIALDDEGRIYNILTHELYKEDDKYYYKKSIIDNKITSFPLYVDANINFNTVTYANVQSYVNNNYDDDSWDDARTGSDLLYVNTHGNSVNSFEHKVSQLLTEWNNDAPHEVVYFYEYNPPVEFEVAIDDDSTYIISNWMDVVTGETISISYGADEDTYDFFDLQVHESGITSGITHYISDGTYDYDHDHVMQTGTTKFRVSINLVNSGEEIYTYFWDFYISKPGATNTYYYESFIERQLLFFDTTSVRKVSIGKMQLGFTLSSSSSAEYVIQKANTSSNSVISTSDFNSYIGPVYNTFEASGGTFLVDLGQDAIDDFIDEGFTKLMIRENEYDYSINTPPYPYQETLIHNWSHYLELEIGQYVITGTTTLDFQLENTGFGVLKSYDSTYYDAWSGTSAVDIAHSSTSGSFESGATYFYDTFEHNLYRTFLNFNTSVLDIYDKYVIESTKLVIKNFNGNNDITIFGGLQSPLSGLTTADFMSFGSFYTSVEGIILDSVINIDLEPSVVDISGNTLFVIRNKVYDYEQNSSASLFSSPFGIDFSNTYFQVTLVPYLISGLDYIQVEKGKNVTLYASRNTSEGEIYWASDSGMTNILSSGNILNINTMNYNNGDIIYAAILDISGNTISQNILSVYLDLYTLNFNGLPQRNFNVHAVDIDSVYFKYHQCLSGVTYAYVRELDDVYEQNEAVSDGSGIGSYNMYSQFDIIDEFFSNSHEVEVVGNLDDVDLNVSQKRINGVYIHEGTRVLLISQIPTDRDGVYVADYNLKLHRTSELDDEDLAFRYKAHVNAGAFLDYEFHTLYYDYIASGATSYEFNYYDWLCLTEYGDGDLVFDFEYPSSDYLFDALTS